jgi:hypothetical protein
MSMIQCKYCDRGVDTDTNSEHEEMCRVETVWDEILTLLVNLKVRNLITEKEYEIMKDDFELVVNDFEGEV